MKDREGRGRSRLGNESWRMGEPTTTGGNWLTLARSLVHAGWFAVSLTCCNGP